MWEQSPRVRVDKLAQCPLPRLAGGLQLVGGPLGMPTSVCLTLSCTHCHPYSADYSNSTQPL